MGCGGGARWAELPVGVKMVEGELDLSKLNPEVEERLNAGIEQVNERLGDVFTEGDQIEVKCVFHPIDGDIFSLARCNYDTDGDGIITNALIRIKCYYWLNEPFDKMVNLIIHELWHCLGFDGHYENKACIGSHWLVEDTETLSICDEMVDDFHAKYPEMK
jgi:hypothetical protein